MSIALVGRASIRQHLLSALDEVNERRQSRVVELFGGAGAGKTRLASWLASHAHETGIGATARTEHSSTGSAEDGLAGMLRRQLQLQNLQYEQAVARALALLPDRDDATAVAEWCSPPTAAAEPTGPGERYALLGRILAALHPDRIIVLLLDDAHLSVDALQFAAYLLEYDVLPALVLLTVRSDVLADRPTEHEALRVLRRARPERYRQIEVGPLSTAEGEELVRHALGLEPELAERVEARIGGNPLFAIQLVGTWIDAGRLAAGPYGFRLVGEDAALPTSLMEAWRARVDELVADWEVEAVTALVIAAALGQHVDDAEWTVACAEAGVAPRWDSAQLLVTRYLLCRSTELRGFSFVHAMFREAWLDYARESNRYVAAQICCARALARLGRTGERSAGHWIAGRRWGEALVDVKVAFDIADREESLARMNRWHSEWSVVLEHRGSSPTEQLEWWLGAFRLALSAADYVRAAEAVEHARALTSATAVDSMLRVRVAIYEARLGLDGPQLAEVEQALLAAISSCPPGESEHRAHAWRLVSVARMRLGRPDAIDAAERALAISSEAGDATGELLALERLALVHNGLGDSEQVERILAAMDACGRRVPWRVRGLMWSMRGEIARRAGDLASAETCYRHSIDQYVRAAAVRSLTGAEFQLASVLIAQQQWHVARERLLRVLGTTRPAGRRAAMAIAHIWLLPVEAALGDWRSWWEHLESGVLLLGPRVEPDVARHMELAGDLASRVGRLTEAHTAWTHAAERWERLGQPERSNELRARMSRDGPA